VEEGREEPEGKKRGKRGKSQAEISQPEEARGEEGAGEGRKKRIKAEDNAEGPVLKARRVKIDAEGDKRGRDDSKTKPSKDKVSERPTLDGIVAEYFRKTNRPYSLLNVFDNLHGKHKKPDLQAAIDRLVAEGVLSMKEFGKSQVYWANQKLIKVDQQTLDTEKNRYTALKDEIGEGKRALIEMRSTLGAIERTPTTVSLQDKIRETTADLVRMKEELWHYQSNDVALVSEVEIQKAEAAIAEVEKLKKKRIEIFKEMVGSLVEATQLSRTDLLSKIGIE